MFKVAASLSIRSTVVRQENIGFGRQGERRKEQIRKYLRFGGIPAEVDGQTKSQQNDDNDNDGDNYRHRLAIRSGADSHGGSHKHRSRLECRLQFNEWIQLSGGGDCGGNSCGGG